MFLDKTPTLAALTINTHAIFFVLHPGQGWAWAQVGQPDRRGRALPTFQSALDDALARYARD